ncbi:UD2C1 glucuronosyltransferase, partial [Pseudoatta argentina]
MSLNCFILFYFVCCILISLVTTSKPLSILFIQPLPSPSHHVWTTNWIKGLLRKGHHVHIISTHETKVKGKLAQNLTYEVFDDFMKVMEESEENYNPVEWERYSILYMLYFTYQWGIHTCDTVVETKAAKKLLEKIKIVEFNIILQDLTLNECLHGLWEVIIKQILKCYRISYLWQRTWNTVYFTVDNFIRHYYYLPIMQRLAEKYIGHTIRPLHEIEKNINILLLNTHPAFDYGIPLPPNTLEISGLNAQARNSRNISRGKRDSHKKVRVIWTHAGLLSTQEAIWKGVLMIVMPFCIDQKFNAQKVVAKNAGIYLDIRSLSTQTVLHAVEEILYNERQRKRLYAMMLNCFTLLFYLVCYILTSLVTTSKALSILLLEPIPSTSHHVWAENLIKGLLREGHHVHITSIHETKIEGKLAQNLTYAVFDDVMKTYEESEDYNPSEWEQYSVFYMGYFTYQWGINACEAMTKTKAAKELLEMIKNVEFDVIVQDITLTQCFYGLWEIAKGKPPIVGYIPFGPAPWLKDFIGGPSYPTVRPYTHAAIAKPVDLWQRTWNTLYYIMDDLIRHYYFLPTVQRLAEKYVGHAIRPLYEIEKDSINIVLINSHPAFDSGIPLPPNTLEIAGLNAQPVKSIVDEVVVTYPENVRVFLDGATNGALVISLGTNIKWKSIGLDKVKTVILALSKLKQRILWKLDIDVPFEVPNNLMTMKWIMQKEVLSHKNVRAIWTHGGLLSTQEAIWKGIPVIVMPFFMDQKSNAQILVAKGVGIYLDVKTLSTQTILHAVEEIFYNESYTKNMKQLSSEFRDRQIPPLDLAIWSIEYTVRHPNGTLVTPLKFQSRIQQNLIDVYVFLFFNIIIILLTIFFAIKIFIYFYYNHIYTASKFYKSKQS